MAYMPSSILAPMPSSLLASIEHARDFRYFGNQNPVKLTKATITLTPVVGGKLIKFNLSAVTDQVILGGEMLMKILVSGVHMDSQKFNLCDAVRCPVSVGDFVINLCQVLPADVTPGSYTLKLKSLNQDGRQLSCVAFDFTIPYDSTIRYPEIV